MKAVLKNYRQSPRKVRLVADLVRGESVPEALVRLSFLDKRAAGPVAKLLHSAVANANQSGYQADDLVISNLVVDKGTVLKRFMPRARGSASRIHKRNSHITVTLSPRKQAHTAVAQPAQVTATPAES